MTVHHPAAARRSRPFPARRRRPSPARLLLLGLYCAVAVTGLALGDWPQWLIAAALFTAAGCRAAPARPRAGGVRQPEDTRGAAAEGTADDRSRA